MTDPISYWNAVSPILSSQFGTSVQDGSSVAAISFAGGDKITPGSSLSALYNEAMIQAILADQALLNTFSGIAANVPTMSAWAESEISSLDIQISSLTSKLNADGGTMSGRTRSINPDPNDLPATPWEIASAAAAGALAGGSALTAASSGMNTQVGSVITQSGGYNYATGSDIGQGGVGNYGAGYQIQQAGIGNYGSGSWLDAMGVFNTQSGTYLLAIGSHNLEVGRSDVEAGNYDTISGSYDTALGNNDTIIGDSAHVYGSNLSASNGQTVFGSTSNYTVINADGTWSRVVNGSGTVGVGIASANSSLMAAELSAQQGAFNSAQVNYNALSSQYSAAGWSQVVSTINADMQVNIGDTDYGGWNFGPAVGALTAVDGMATLSAMNQHLGDSSGVGSLSPWGPTTSAADMATLSAMIQHYGADSPEGEDATAAFELISAHLDPTVAFNYEEADETNPPFGGISPQDRKNIVVAEAEAAGSNWGALEATFSTLATSSNPIIASIASAELMIYDKDGHSAVGGCLLAMSEYDSTGSISSATILSLDEKLSSATGSKAVWTGSGFIFSMTDAALFSAVDSSVNSANASIHILRDHRGSAGDGELNSDGETLEKAVSSFQANPNDQTDQALDSAEDEYLSRLEYDHASSGSITSVEESVNKIRNATSYSSITFDPGGTMEGDGKIGYQVQETLIATEKTGDCVTLAALKAMSMTSKGEQILEKSVKKNSDDSYDVQFAGDHSQTFHITKQEMKSDIYGDFDDPYTKALVIGVDQYYIKHGSGIDGGGMGPLSPLELLSGSLPEEHYSTLSASPSEIKAYLATIASGVGKDLDVIFSGTTGPSNQDWSASKITHEFAMTGIDEKAGTISYTNPLDSKITHTMTISQFANQASSAGVGLRVTHS